MTSRLHGLFTIFMFGLICFAIARFWQRLLGHHLFFLDLCMFLSLFLRSNSVVLLSTLALTWNLQTFVLVMWDNWLEMGMIWPKICMHFMFICFTIAMMVLMVRFFVRRKMLVFLNIPICVIIVLFIVITVHTVIKFVFLLVSMLIKFELTPLLFVIIMWMWWLPCMTTEMKANRFIFNIINVMSIMVLLVMDIMMLFIMIIVS